eukprot:2206340-Pyramimonas_sp.AAC.1
MAAVPTATVLGMESPSSESEKKEPPISSIRAGVAAAATPHPNLRHSAPHLLSHLITREFDSSTNSSRAPHMSSHGWRAQIRHLVLCRVTLAGLRDTLE